jgi:type I restriction enzyme, S subunit
VAAKERVLGLLAEKRRALITRAVTRGLDPRAPLRDSGIPWLGEIPVHWEIERTRWLFRERDERSETGEEELLTVSHLTGVTPRS